jgi:hypothetical protein
MDLSVKLETIEAEAIGFLDSSDPIKGLSQSRRIIEGICTVIFYRKKGDEAATDLLAGRTRPEPHDRLTLEEMIDEIAGDHSHSVYFNIERDDEEIVRTTWRDRLSKLRVLGNRASHDQTDARATVTAQDLTQGQESLSVLLNDMYPRFFDRRVPKSVVDRLKLPVDPLAIHVEDIRGKDIVRRYYSKQPEMAHLVESVSVEKIAYEFVSIEVSKANYVGHLFLKKYCTLRSSLTHFLKTLDHPLQNLIICVHRKYNASTLQPIDRLGSAQTAFEEVNKLHPSKFIGPTEFRYLDELIWDYCVFDDRKSILPFPSELAEHLVHQKVYHTTSHRAITSGEFLHRVAERTFHDTPIFVVLGRAGVGKTTFCEWLACEINKKPNRRALYLSATDLREASSISTISTIWDLYDLAAGVNRINAQERLHPIDVEISISVGNLIVIIDGLDEIESVLGEKFVLDQFLRSIVDLHENHGGCSVVITSRDSESERYAFDQFSESYHLHGFDQLAVNEYLTKRFEGQQAIISKAKAELGRIEVNADHCTPLYLRLICDIVERQPNDAEPTVEQASSYFDERFPIDSLVKRLLDREITKQSLGETSEQYFELLLQVALGDGGRLSQSLLDTCAGYLFPRVQSLTTPGALKRIYRSPLLLKVKGSDQYAIRFQSIEVWLKARHLIRSLKDPARDLDEDLVNIVSEMYHGQSQLFSEMKSYKTEYPDFDPFPAVARWVGNVQSRLKSNPDRIQQERFRRAMSGLLYLALTQIHRRDENTIIMEKVFGGAEWSFMTVYGDFHPVDFSGATVSDGLFVGYGTFQKCGFPSGRITFKRCEFQNIDAPLQQLDPKLFIDCNLSDTLQQAIYTSVRRTTATIETLKSDFYRLLKVGYQGGKFVWKSSLVYRQAVTNLSSKIQGVRLIDFLMQRDLLRREDELTRRGEGYGYVVTRQYQQDAKQLIENQNITTAMMEAIRAAMAEFNK